MSREVQEQLLLGSIGASGMRMLLCTLRNDLKVVIDVENLNKKSSPCNSSRVLHLIEAIVRRVTIFTGFVGFSDSARGRQAAQMAETTAVVRQHPGGSVGAGRVLQRRPAQAHGDGMDTEQAARAPASHPTVILGAAVPPTTQAREPSARAWTWRGVFGQ